MITIRSRATKRGKVTVRTFELNADAERYVKALPESHEVEWEGAPERPRPTPARAMWTGAVSFGMINIPIKIYSATEDGAPALHQVCREHGSRMRFKRWCDHGHELGAGETMKGVEVGGQVVPIADEDLAKLPKALAKTVAIQEFAPAASVPAVFRDRPYFAGPDKSGRHAYDLLVAALRETNTVAICSIVIREREHLAALEPDGDSLILWTLRRSSEIRSNARLPLMDGGTAVNPAELKMATTLIKTQTVTAFEPARHSDRYAAALRDLVEAKASAAVPEGPQADVIDLMASLKGSVERARKDRKAS